MRKRLEQFYDGTWEHYDIEKDEATMYDNRDVLPEDIKEKLCMLELATTDNQDIPAQWALPWCTVIEGVGQRLNGTIFYLD